MFFVDFCRNIIIVLRCIKFSGVCFQDSLMDEWVFVEMIWVGGQFELRVDWTTQGSVTFKGKFTIYHWQYYFEDFECSINIM